MSKIERNLNFKLSQVPQVALLLQKLALKMLAEKELFVTVRDLAFCLTAINGTIQVSPVPLIASKQEEADTKMLLCSQHSHSLGFLRVNIVTIDFDVAILSLYYQSRVGAHLSLEYGIYYQEDSNIQYCN